MEIQLKLSNNYLQDDFQLVYLPSHFLCVEAICQGAMASKTVVHQN